MDRQPGGGSKDQNPQQVTTFNSARHVQGQGVERVDGEGVHVLGDFLKRNYLFRVRSVG